jgi:hypothetical protein
MVDLHDNLLDLMKLFLAMTSDFMKSLLRRMGGGKGRKMSGGSAVKDQRKRLKQKLFKTETAIKNILLKKLSAQRDAEHLGLPGIK